MAQKFLIECTECGRRMPIEISQAGQTVTCPSCKTPRKLGTMRELRAMQPSPSEESEPPASDPGKRKRRKPDREWDPVKGSLYVFGLLLVAIGMIVGGYSHWSAATIDTTRPVRKVTDEERRRVKAVSIAQMNELWSDVKEDLVQDWQEHPWIKRRREAGIARGWGWGGVATAGIGLACLFAAFQITPQTHQRRIHN